MNHAVRGVLFDAAGTLIRPRESVGATYARLARAHGASVSAWRLDDAFRRIHAQASPMAFPGAAPVEVPEREGAWWREVVRRTFRAAECSMRPDDEGALFEALWSAFASPAAWETLPGAQEALSALRDAGLRCAVVSNFDGRLPALLEGLGLLELFDGAVFLPGNTGFAKPDPGIFLHAARALGLSPAECVYVGDHPDDDVAAAIAVGMGAIDVGGLATLADLPAQLAASFEARGAPPEPPA